LLNNFYNLHDYFFEAFGAGGRICCFNERVFKIDKSAGRMHFGAMCANGTKINSCATAFLSAPSLNTLFV